MNKLSIRTFRMPSPLRLFPRRLRLWLADRLIGEPGLVHRVYLRCRWQVEKWNLGLPPDVSFPSAVLRADPKRWGKPEVLLSGYNAVPNIGEDVIIGLLTNGEAGMVATAAYNNANAKIGVGDSTAAFAETQTNLQAVTNKLRKAMNATYPKDNATEQQVEFQSDFGSAEANFAWQEWALFNHVTDGSGQMLSRKVESFGTKASGSTWTLTATYDLSGV